MPKRLADAPPPPKDLLYLFNWYRQLFAGEVISFQEIDAWSRLTRKDVTPTEVEILKQLEDVYWQVQNERRNRKSGTKR